MTEQPEDLVLSIPILVPQVSFGTFRVETEEGHDNIVALQVKTLLTEHTYTFERGHFIQMCSEGLKFAQGVKPPPRTRGLAVVEKPQHIETP